MGEEVEEGEEGGVEDEEEVDGDVEDFEIWIGKWEVSEAVRLVQGVFRCRRPV